MPESEIKRTFTDVATWLREPAEKLRINSGVACFSIRRDDQHMWGTYGVNHSGACIEFYDRTEASEIHRRAQPVLNKDGSLATKLPELIQDNLSVDLHRLALWCYFVKSTDWRDEREWRVFTLATRPFGQTKDTWLCRRRMYAGCFVGLGCSQINDGS